MAKGRKPLVGGIATQAKDVVSEILNKSESPLSVKEIVGVIQANYNFPDKAASLTLHTYNAIKELNVNSVSIKSGGRGKPTKKYSLADSTAEESSVVEAEVAAEELIEV